MIKMNETRNRAGPKTAFTRDEIKKPFQQNQPLNS